MNHRRKVSWMQCNRVEDVNNEFYLIGLYTKPISGLFKCSIGDCDVKYQKLMIKILNVLYSEVQFTNNLLAGHFEIDIIDPKWILLNADNDDIAINYFIQLHKDYIKSNELKLKAYRNNLIAIESKFKNEL